MHVPQGCDPFALFCPLIYNCIHILKAPLEIIHSLLNRESQRHYVLLSNCTEVVGTRSGTRGQVLWLPTQYFFFSQLMYLKFFKIYLLIMLLQLSHFPRFTPLHPAHPLPPTFPPYSSCPWVIHTYKFFGFYIPILFLPSSCLFSTCHLCYLFSVPFPFSLPPTPLLITLHVISISVVLFLF